MKSISSYIDHSVLKAITDEASIRQLCAEAMIYNFTAVCVPPYYITLAKELLINTNVKIVTVIGFPLGYNLTEIKLAETYSAIAKGADEIDMVQNLCAVKNKDWRYLSEEVAGCLQPIRLHSKKLKIILETGELTREEIIKCCEIYAKHKVDFIKTSTGFSAQGGADVATVRLLRQHLPAGIEIKAAGGIRNYKTAQECIEAGASRLGTSSGIEIFRESIKK